jgi:hypothetical protein
MNKDERRAYERKHRSTLVANGKCKDCASPREGDGCTRTMCKACADKKRAKQRARNGTPLDAPVEKQLHPRQTDVVLGSLTRADVKHATTLLPMRPPGK